MKFDVSFDGLDDTLLTLQAMPRQIETASRRAVATVTRQTNREVLREMAAAADVPQKLLRSRRRVIQRLPARRQGNRPRGSVWAGTQPLPAGYLVTNAQRRNLLLGKQTRGGARAGKHFFPGAFWAEVRGEAAYIRRGRTAHVGIFKRRERARLPIDEQTVSLEIPPGARARIEGGVPQRLTKALRHEIRFEVLVRNRR